MATKKRTDDGDWSWKPARDKALGDRMITFKGVPPSAAALAHAQSARAEPRSSALLGST